MQEGENKLTITTGSWVRGVVVIAAALVLFLVRDLILVFFASIVIASAIEPAAIWAKKRNIPRVPTVLTIYVSVAIILAGVIFFLVLPLIEEASDFVRTLPNPS